jgi:DNA primase
VEDDYLGNSQPITPKYVVKAAFEVDGVVEKSDVIGAIFGQTEGLFGPDLDLHALQKTGRIGRIEIKMESKQDETRGSILIPSSLDKPITALTAAAVESVDRIGPCSARVTLTTIEDIRVTKRESIISRAQDILQKWIIESTPTIAQLTSKVSEALKVSEIVSYGSDKLSAGPDVASSKAIIIVEGRADVGVLLKTGLKNVIACEGTNIPETLIKLSKTKEVTAFLDGDRGGDLILKGLMQVAKVDYVARAPKGVEVETLSPKQILKALNEKISVNLKDSKEKPLAKKARSRKPRRAPTRRRKKQLMTMPEPIVSAASKLKGTLEAVLLNEKYQVITQIPVSDLCTDLQETEAVHTIVFDGVITQRLVDISGDRGVKRILGDRISGVIKRPVDIQLLTVSEITKGDAT